VDKRVNTIGVGQYPSVEGGYGFEPVSDELCLQAAVSVNAVKMMNSFVMFHSPIVMLSVNIGL
jgi:hypothetical protein